MFKNPNYIYGGTDVLVPPALQYGEFLLRRMWPAREKVALINAATGESTTYYEICQRGMNFAVSLTHLGLRKGQAVAICSENRSDFFGVVLGISCAGGVVTTINPAYVEDELRHIMKISKPKVVVCSPLTYKQHGKLFISLPHVKYVILLGNEKQPGTLSYNDLTIPVNNENVTITGNNDVKITGTGNNGATITGNNGATITGNNVTITGNTDVIAKGPWFHLTRNVRYEEFEVVEVQGQTDTAFILYSSGTTGLPKGVMLTHLNVITNGSFPPALTEVNSLVITPWFHVMGLMGTLVTLAMARTCIYLPKFEVDLYLRTIEKYKINLITVVPPVLVALFKAPKKYDLSSVKYIYSGAAPLHKDTVDLVNTTFPNVHAVHQGYGMTESTLSVIKGVPGGLDKPGSVGVVNPGITIKVVDVETRKPLGPNQPGEICMKGPLIMKGYVGQDPKETFDDEGFYLSGDIGYYDEDKYFFIVDRLKELIKYKGYQVAPAELEALLLKHEGIRDAGVVGVKDSRAGEIPLAFVVKQPGMEVTADDVKKFVADRVSNPKHLRGGVIFVNAIPKNPSGKILRRELKKMAKTAKSKL